MLFLPKDQRTLSFTTGLIPSQLNPWCKWQIANYKEVSDWVDFSEDFLPIVDKEIGITTTFLQTITLIRDVEKAPTNQQFELILMPAGGLPEATRKVKFNLTLQ